VQENDNFRIQCFLYIAQAKINWHFLTGTFKEGLVLVPELESKLKELHLFIDQHRVMVLTYKMASLYFGSGDYDTCIDYLQKILNDTIDLRNDLQSYARLMHLLAHYELGNHELLQYLTKSVYRFMAKKKNLAKVEEEILRFLRRSYYMPRDRVKPELQKFLEQIKAYEKNRFQTRVFVYLDIISWVESKVYNKPISAIIHQKYLDELQSRSQRKSSAAGVVVR
jgi:tetratricopeptide (TPR) repeat protein